MTVEVRTGGDNAWGHGVGVQSRYKICNAKKHGGV